MKYVLLFTAEGDDIRRYAAMSQEERAAQFAKVGAWFGEHRGKITGGNQLADPKMATTVRFRANGDPLVSDGPFLEANEVIGGYAEVEVADLDEALRMAKTWPPKGTIEVRPVLAQS